MPFLIIYSNHKEKRFFPSFLSRLIPGRFLNFYLRIPHLKFVLMLAPSQSCFEIQIIPLQRIISLAVYIFLERVIFHLFILVTNCDRSYLSKDSRLSPSSALIVTRCFFLVAFFIARFQRTMQISLNVNEIR